MSAKKKSTQSGAEKAMKTYFDFKLRKEKMEMKEEKMERKREKKGRRECGDMD